MLSGVFQLPQPRAGTRRPNLAALLVGSSFLGVSILTGALILDHAGSVATQATAGY